MIIGARAHDYPRNNPHALFAAIAGDGWQTIQLAPRKAFDGVYDAAAVNAALKESGLSVGVLGCYVEIGSIDENERVNAVETFKRGAETAAALNARCIGTETTNLERQGCTREEAIDAVKRSLSEIMPFAEKLGVTVCIEPVKEHTINTPELTREILDAFKSPNLGVILDGVNLLWPQDAANQAALWKRCFDSFGGVVKAFHLKSASGRPLRESAADFGLLLSLFSPDADTPILREEVIPAIAREDIAFMKKIMGGNQNGR